MKLPKISLPRVKFGREWSIQFWTNHSVLYLKLCRDWDGKFVVDKAEGVLPLWGFRREDRTQKLDKNTLTPKTRTVKGWRLWWPYVMVWYMDNTLDQVEIALPGPSDTVH